jgi:HAMP domain-containing protein
VRLSPAPDSSLLRSNDGQFWSRCEPVFEQWRLCALAPVGELHALRNELVRVGEAEGRSLALWLIIAAIVSLLTFAGVMLLLSQRITRPLMQITEAVRAVARGDWKSEVTGVHRADEVGDIARAVIVLQRSLQERDRLRSDVAHAESVKKRREALEDAIRRFDRIMRSVLLSVSNSVETMDETARELARVSAVAEGEAVEAAFVSENTVSNVSSVRSATERLSAAISETVDGIRQAADVIALSNTAAQSASASAEGLARTTGEIDAIMRAIAEIAAQTNALALNATVQASRAAGGGNFSAVVSDIKDAGEPDRQRERGHHATPRDDPQRDRRDRWLGALDRAEARHRAASDPRDRACDGAAGRRDARDRRKHVGGGERLGQRVVERRAAQGHHRGRARRLDEGRHQGDRHGRRGASPRLDRQVVPARSDRLRSESAR